MKRSFALAQRIKRPFPLADTTAADEIDPNVVFSLNRRVLFQRRKENRFSRPHRGNNKRGASKREWTNRQLASLGTHFLEPVGGAEMFSLWYESTSSSDRYHDALVDQGVGWRCLNDPKMHVAPVCHPLGLPLLRLLNDGDIGTNSIVTNERDCDELGATLRGWINQFKRCDDWIANKSQKQALERALQGVFETKPHGFNTAITCSTRRSSIKDVSKVFEASGHVNVNTDWNEDINVKPDRPPKEHVSMVLSEKFSPWPESRPVALFQCGFLTYDEFQKMNFLAGVRHGIDNLEVLSKQTDPGDDSDLPLLLVVATFAKDSSDETLTDRLVGKVAVWLCWSNVKPDKPHETMQRHKMALLWREETGNAGTMAQALFKCHDAAAHLAQWQSSSDTSYKDTFVNLGPNCSVYSLDGKVAAARSYDTRWRDSYRSPSFYLNTEISTEATKGSSAIMLFKDKNYNAGTDDEGWASLDFGVDLPEHLHPDWMWQFRGKLQVIATPYIEGDHGVSTPSLFLGVVDDLFQLTKAGYVHGDIRFFNMAFGDERGHLIDYDMCGKQADKKYPRGYISVLGDGIRAGSAEEVMEVEDDWSALWSVLSFTYVVVAPDAETNERRRELERFFFDGTFTTGSLEAHVEMLKAFILRCSECMPSRKLSRLLLTAKELN